MSAKRAPLALLVEVRDQYGTRQIAATPVYLGDDGDLRNPLFEWSGRYNDVADLEISALVDTGSNPVRGRCPVWAAGLVQAVPGGVGAGRGHDQDAAQGAAGP